MIDRHAILLLTAAGFGAFGAAQSQSFNRTDHAGRSSVSGLTPSFPNVTISESQQSISSVAMASSFSSSSQNYHLSDWERANCDEWVRHASTMPTLELAEWGNVDSKSDGWIRPFTASDSACASQWFTWIRNVGMSESVRRNLDLCTVVRSTMTHVDTIRRFVSRQTECDGIPRGSYETLGYTTSTRIGNFLDQDDDGMRWAIEQQYNSVYSWANRDWARTHPPPSCSLVGQDGVRAWENIHDIFHIMVPKQWNGIRMFGYPPTPNKCNFTGAACVADVEEVRLIYFEPDVESANLCGDDGHGLYNVRPSDVGGPVLSQVVSAITFGRNLRRYNVQDSATISGPFTFTSGHYYLAYIGARGYDLCSLVGPQTFLSGVVEVPLTSLSTGIFRPQSEWRGNDLDLAKFLAAGQADWSRFRSPEYKGMSAPSGDEGLTDRVHNMAWFSSSRLLNVADLRGPVPAANYYMQPLRDIFRCKNCSTIIEGNYDFAFSLPDVLRYLDPAWSTCITDFHFITDPPLVLTATKRYSASGPAWASGNPISKQSLDRFTTLPKPGQSIVPVTPTPTRAAAPAATATATARIASESLFQDTIPAAQEPHAQKTVANNGLSNDLNHIHPDLQDQLERTSPGEAFDREQQNLGQIEKCGAPERDQCEELPQQVAVASKTATRITGLSPYQEGSADSSLRIHADSHPGAAGLDPLNANDNEQETGRPDDSMEDAIQPDRTSLTSTQPWPFTSSLRSDSGSNVAKIRKSSASRRAYPPSFPWTKMIRDWTSMWRGSG